MQIFNSGIKSIDNFITSMSKSTKKPAKTFIIKEQGPSMSRDKIEEKNTVLVDISNEAKRLQEELKRSKESAKASKKAMEDFIKVLEIARRISNGDKVPLKDENKLMEYSSELYQTAKMAGSLKDNEKIKEYKSLFKDKKDNKIKISVHGKDNVIDTLKEQVSLKTDAQVET